MTRILESQIEHEAGSYVVVRHSPTVFQVYKREGENSFAVAWPDARDNAIVRCNYLAREEKARK